MRTFWGQTGKRRSVGFRIVLGVFIFLWLCVVVTAEARPSKVYYLYITACESCREVSGLIDALPETIQVTTGEEKFTSPMEVVQVNLTADTGGALALFDAFHVPMEDQTAPMVLAGSAYYAGVDAIRRFISDGLPAGAALYTQEVSGASAPPALEWGPALVAGFVGGLNPCALSMLLLFLTVIGSLEANIARYSAVFLGTKFVTYLVIGTLLLGAFQAWNPLWLQLVAKIMLTGLSIFLIVLNLRDAWMAKGERYGEIKNQLPASLRRGLQARIRSALEKPVAPLLAVVVALGVLVAAGEFLCAGQVYLATLLTAIQTGRNLNTFWPMLIGYCLAFLSPSMAVSFAVSRGQALFTVSEFVRRRMPLIKLVTALFFVAALIYVWVA